LHYAFLKVFNFSLTAKKAKCFEEGEKIKGFNRKDAKCFAKEEIEEGRLKRMQDISQRRREKWL